MAHNLSRKRWTEDEKMRLRELVATGKYTYPEIAIFLGRGKASTLNKGLELGLKNKAYINQKTKHKHLREPVMRYFLTHTWEETRVRFGLTRSELKTIFTVSYRDPKLSHLRKDRRRKDPWTIKETLALCQNAGLISRREIARRLNRGSMHAVKEAASRLNSSTRYLNGIPLNLAQLIDPQIRGIKTRAGAPGPNGKCHFNLIPWVVLEDVIKRRGCRVPEEIQIGVKALASFQRFIYGETSSAAIVNKMKKTVGVK